MEKAKTISKSSLKAQEIIPYYIWIYINNRKVSKGIFSFKTNGNIAVDSIALDAVSKESNELRRILAIISCSMKFIHIRPGHFLA